MEHRMCLKPKCYKFVSEADGWWEMLHNASGLQFTYCSKEHMQADAKRLEACYRYISSGQYMPLDELRQKMQAQIKKRFFV